MDGKYIKGEKGKSTEDVFGVCCFCLWSSVSCCHGYLCLYPLLLVFS